MSKKTILIDLTSLYDHITGIERYAMEIAWHMVSAHSNSNYILVFKNEIHERFAVFNNQSNVKCVVIKGGNKLLFSQIRLPMFLSRHKANAYLFLAFPEPLLWNKKNTFVAVHDMSPWEAAEGMKPLSRWYFRMSWGHAFKKARKIITISKFSAERICKVAKIRASKIWLIYCGVIADEDFAIDDIKSDEVKKKYELPEKYILSLSTLEPRKNISLLIETYCQMFMDGNTLPKLVLAGRKGWKVDEAILNENISEKKRDRLLKIIEDNVIFTDYVKEEDLKYIYSMAEYFIFPSKYEGFGMPPLEALSCGTLVLSSNAASMPEVLGDAAVYFDSGDSDSLKTGILQMQKLSEERRRELLERAKARVNNFNWLEEASKLEKKISTLDTRIRLG